MKQLFTALILLFVFALSAQESPEKCRYTYFNNKMVSTKTCMNNAQGRGKATAYNRSGKVIYEKEISTRNMHSSVSFSYYPSGAVQKAQYHSAPDAGIQWYNTTTYFNEDGTISQEIEDSWDDKPTFVEMMKPTDRDSAKPVRVKLVDPEYYTNEIWFINTSRRKMEITAQSKTSKEIFRDTLAPGDTAKIGQYKLVQLFDAPQKYYAFTACIPGKKQNRHYIIEPMASLCANTSKDVRRYYFSLRKK